MGVRPGEDFQAGERFRNCVFISRDVQPEKHGDHHQDHQSGPPIRDHLLEGTEGNLSSVVPEDGAKASESNLEKADLDSKCRRPLSIQIFLHKHWAESPSPSGVEEMVDPGIFLSSLLLTQVPEKRTVRKNEQRNHAQKEEESFQAQEWREVQGGQRLEQRVQGRWTGGSSGTKAFEAPNASCKTCF